MDELLGFLVGQTVVAVEASPDGSLRVVFEASDGEEPTLYVDLSGEITLEPSPPQLVGVRVARTSEEQGVLRLWFDGGQVVSCAPDERFEAWEVVGGARYSLVVCMPGGEVAFVDRENPGTDEEIEQFVAELLGRSSDDTKRQDASSQTE